MRWYNYIVWNLDADRPDCADIMNSEFRPFRTEREKAIDEMSSAMRDRGHGINPVTLGELYDAGFMMVKP